ncbi:MAG: hypothetical protein NTZ48_05645 [Candidatus Omnitrophica bacterium]|nr:hypothetical protein [Candidatus Omnitrophota bacterium]
MKIAYKVVSKSIGGYVSNQVRSSEALGYIFNHKVLNRNTDLQKEGFHIFIFDRIEDARHYCNYYDTRELIMECLVDDEVALPLFRYALLAYQIVKKDTQSSWYPIGTAMYKTVIPLRRMERK